MPRTRDKRWWKRQTSAANRSVQAIAADTRRRSVHLLTITACDTVTLTDDTVKLTDDTVRLTDDISTLTGDAY